MQAGGGAQGVGDGAGGGRGGELERLVQAISYRKVLAEELEEAGVAAGQVEWARRRLEVEAVELREQVAGLRTGQGGQVAVRRQLEEEATGLRGDLEKAVGAAGWRRSAGGRPWRWQVAWGRRRGHFGSSPDQEEGGGRGEARGARGQEIRSCQEEKRSEGSERKERRGSPRIQEAKRPERT